MLTSEVRESRWEGFWMWRVLKNGKLLFASPYKKYSSPISAKRSLERCIEDLRHTIKFGGIRNGYESFDFAIEYKGVVK